MSIRLLVVLLALGGAAIAALPSCTQHAAVRPTLEVRPATARLVTGEALQLVVARRFPGGPVELVTERVAYATSNRAIAIASDRGVVTGGVAPGEVLVQVRDPETDAVATASVTVEVPQVTSIDIVPWPSVEMRPGAFRRFTAAARFETGVVRDVTAEVQWSSSNDRVVTVGSAAPDFGLVTARAAGDAIVTAALQGSSVAGRTSVVVAGADVVLRAIRIAPNPASAPPGQTVQLGAVGVRSDGSEQDLTALVTWASSDEAVARIDARGIATGLSAGRVTITATSRIGEANGSPVDVRGSAELVVP